MANEGCERCALAALNRDALIEAVDRALSRKGYWKGDRRLLAEAALQAVGLVEDSRIPTRTTAPQPKPGR